MSTPIDRRTFLESAAAFTGLALWPAGCAAPRPLPLQAAPRPKAPGRVRGAFFYPPAEVVLAGECEDGWSKHKWFTWPGNQFAPEEQQLKFSAELSRMSADLDIDLALEERPLYTDAAIRAFVADIEETRPEALLLFNFWNTFSSKLDPILAAFDGPIIVYHPVGSNHQLPPRNLRTAARVQYIHSIENWAALERGLRAVHAHTRMKRSRLLRVSGRLEKEADATEPFFGMPIHGVPAAHFNQLFDDTVVSDDMVRLASQIRHQARKVSDLSEQAFLDAARAHAAVQELMRRHEADAITIECLFLKHRKPCLSFALHNGTLVPCGCENDLNATLTLMLGASAFGRGGFQHNPEFDTENNLYFGSHCTCTTHLHGPDGAEAPYDLRPFFHQLPKTLALDVQWPAGEAVTLLKYHSGKKLLDAWRGELVSSPTCPPTGGCATRALVKFDGLDDVCQAYPGPHPALFCGDFARHMKTFAQLYDLEIRTNA